MTEEVLGSAWDRKGVGQVSSQVPICAGSSGLGPAGPASTRTSAATSSGRADASSIAV
ncbi:hypothetical protein AB0G67_48910 [Streptomyces sp. NPDC021056]|uniref:hypothetical protein n=1 Tax=Streptomyces sp. NPDC021056 TaxID=3155012 RepID=UPI0033CFE5EF